VDVDVAWAKLDNDDKLIPDFIRIAEESEYSVQTGHELLAAAVPAEFKEITGVYELSKGKTLAKSKLTDELNEMPQRCFVTAAGGPKVQVISWGQWAMFFQRHIGHAIQSDFDLQQNKWGVPDDAKEFSAKCDKIFGGLRLYPFVRLFNCTDSASYHSAVDDAFKITVATPQLTPAMCWNHLCYYGPNKELYTPNPNPHINEWHKHNPPPGTAYNPLPPL
jgi:hypothetical protein